MPLLAAVYAMNFGLNYVKDHYTQCTVGNWKGNDFQQKMMVINCCALKPIVTWHSERVATICRERCGGQGFLSANRLGESIIGAHAGMSAEGDNAVLMQKVAKELLSLLQMGDLNLYQYEEVNEDMEEIHTIQLQHFLHWFSWKESLLMKTLATTVQAKLASGKDLFSIWMYEESDLIQSVARAYGERLIVERCIIDLNNVDSSLKTILNLVFMVYSCSLIERDLGWYLTEGIITVELGKQITNLSRSLCSELSTFAVDLVESFKVPDYVFQAPIASDWVKYNEHDNRGEVKPYPNLFGRQ